MTLALGLTLGAIVGLLIVSAFFSGSETALTAASRARMHALEEDGVARAGLVNRLLYRLNGLSDIVHNPPVDP